MEKTSWQKLTDHAGSRCTYSPHIPTALPSGRVYPPGWFSSPTWLVLFCHRKLVHGLSGDVHWPSCECHQECHSNTLALSILDAMFVYLLDFIRRNAFGFGSCDELYSIERKHLGHRVNVLVDLILKGVQPFLSKLGMSFLLLLKSLP